MLGLVDWELLILLIRMFVVNHALQKTGLPARLVSDLAGAGIPLQHAGPLFATTFVLSNIVSNVPAVMLQSYSSALRLLWRTRTGCRGDFGLSLLSPGAPGYNRSCGYAHLWTRFVSLDVNIRA
jgi:hypothetical protein